jgi:hypothetical protein
LFTNRLLWLGASAGAVPLWGSGCRNLALPGVYEQALTFSQLLPDFFIAELDARNYKSLRAPAL